MAYMERKGSNINFVSKLTATSFKVRTYERGVEDETLACGTGVTAVALAMHYAGNTHSNEVAIEVEGGNLKVVFDCDYARYTNIRKFNWSGYICF